MTRQRALRSLCDYLHDPEHIAVCIDHEVPKSLQTLLTDADPFCRYKSAECLFVLACNYNGRKAIVENNIIPTLAILFDDEVVQARINAHKTVEMVSELPYGAEAIINLKLIKTLTLKLNTEVDVIKDLILDTLHFCMQINTTQALEAKALAEFTSHLKDSSAEIRSKSARDIFDIWFVLCLILIQYM